jgi:hypothetical protein
MAGEELALGAAVVGLLSVLQPPPTIKASASHPRAVNTPRRRKGNPLGGDHTARKVAKRRASGQLCVQRRGPPPPGV